MRKTLRAVGTAAFALVAISAAMPSQAEDYPSRPVHLIVGFGPGSSGDLVSRGRGLP